MNIYLSDCGSSTQSNILEGWCTKHTVRADGHTVANPHFRPAFEILQLRQIYDYPAHGPTFPECVVVTVMSILPS